MTRKFSPDDFANARFAEHPNPEYVDARFAARMNTDPAYPWLLDGVPGNTDEAMSQSGWVPVPTKPTITESQLARAAAGVWGDEGSGPMGTNGYARGFLFRLGINVDPDPEPTNKERLAQLIGGGTKANKQYADGLAEYLDDMGVTAPEGNA